MLLWVCIHVSLTLWECKCEYECRSLYIFNLNWMCRGLFQIPPNTIEHINFFSLSLSHYLSLCVYMFCIYGVSVLCVRLYIIAEYKLVKWHKFECAVVCICVAFKVGTTILLNNSLSLFCYASIQSLSYVYFFVISFVSYIFIQHSA